MSEHTELSLTEALANKYSGQEWAFVPQVPNATGMNKTRTADGLAMSLWPSKGLHLHGFEIKVARSDWLSEIQDPTKANAFARYCHYWWVVAPTGVAKIEEMPADWGWMAPTKTGLRVKKAATFVQEPEPIDFVLLAGIFRACLRSSDSEKRVRQARQEGYQAGVSTANRRAETNKSVEQERDERELRYLRKSIADFEESSGVKISRWDAGRIGEVVSAVMATDKLTERLARTRDELQKVVASCDRALETTQ